MAKKNKVTMELRNTQLVLSNLNREIKKIKWNTSAGLVSAVALIREDMDRTPPLIPEDWGNLRGSWSPGTPQISGGTHWIEFGFHAEYAATVHYMLDGGVRWSRPGSGPLFFSSALSRNSVRIIETIRNNVKLR